MDTKTKQAIDAADGYREKSILALLLAFDDDNDARLHEIYQTIICQVDDDLPDNFEELVILD